MNKIKKFLVNGFLTYLIYLKNKSFKKSVTKCFAICKRINF